MVKCGKNGEKMCFRYLQVPETFLEHFGPLEESDLEIFDHLTFKTNKYIP